MNDFDEERIEVCGVGPRNARIALIGEAPGAEEEAAGIPFVGRAGRLLDNCLSEAKINRSDCYIDNTIRFRPPGNKINYWFGGKKNFKHPSETALESRKLLAHIIRTIRPNLVVALGATPLWALTDEDTGITKKRGSLYDSTIVEGVKVLATIHPAYVLRQWGDRPLLVFDLKRAKVELTSPELILPPAEYLIDPEFWEVMATLEYFKRDAKELSFDIETGQRIISCLGLSCEVGTAISIPFLRNNDWRWTQSEERAIWRSVGELFNMDIPVVGQGMVYDIAWLARFMGIYPRNIGTDTMLAHHEVYLEQKKSLDFIASLYTKHRYWKDDVKDWHTAIPDKKLWGYNAKDADVTLECAGVIRKEVEDAGVGSAVEFSQSLIKPFTYMQLKGINWDKKKAHDLKVEYSKDLVESEELLNEAVGREVNPRSPQQMKKLLFGELGLPEKKKRATGELTTDEGALVALKDHTDSPILDLIIMCRRLSKFISTYIDMRPDYIDGRMRCSFNIAGTNTGRISTHSNAFWTGGNLQNIPKRHEGGKRIRECFIPDPGYIFLEMDMVQAEAMYVAWEAKETVLIDAFLAGRDTHAELAAFIFDKSLEECGKGTIERLMGKKTHHASNYMMGPIRMKSELNKEGFAITAAETKLYLKRRFQLHSMIPMWHRGIQSELRKSRVMTTVLGRRRLFGERWGDELFRQAYAFRPQGTVGHLLNIYLLRAFEDCPHIEPLLQSHDSVLSQVRPEHAEEAVSWFRENCQDELIVGDRPLVIPLEFEVGEDWANMEEYK